MFGAYRSGHGNNAAVVSPTRSFVLLPQIALHFGSIYLIQHTLNNWFGALDIEKLSAAAAVVALLILALVALLNRAWNLDAGQA